MARTTLCRRRNAVTEAYPGGCADGDIRSQSGHSATLRAANWRCLGRAGLRNHGYSRAFSAASSGYPLLGCRTFGAAGRNDPDVLADERFAFTPWLKLISSRNGARRA
jgi:hypothetical protein